MALLQRPALVQRFGSTITLALCDKYTVVSNPPMSSALRCFALGLVWGAFFPQSVVQVVLVLQSCLLQSYLFQMITSAES